MSNTTRIAERQRTDTSSPMPVDAVRDLLAVVRALEARVAVLESLLASAIAPPGWVAKPRHADPVIAGLDDVIAFVKGDKPRGTFITWKTGCLAPADAISANLRLPTVPDAYGR